MEFTVFFIVVVVVMIALVVAAQQNQALNLAYEELARRYGGHCDPGGLFGKPSVQFIHAGSRVVVDIYSTGGKHPTRYTQVHFPWPHADFRCEVYPTGFWSRVKQLVGMEDIEIGSPDFDEAYIITSNDQAALRSLLNAVVQSQIEHLRGYLGNGDIYVAFKGGGLLVKKLSLIKSSLALQRFVELAIGLYDQAALTLQQGIEFAAESPLPKAGEVMCQICGEAVTSDAVFCRKCKTPHHRDCWVYYGACSTYGCRETRFIAPRSKGAAKLHNT